MFKNNINRPVVKYNLSRAYFQQIALQSPKVDASCSTYYV